MKKLIKIAIGVLVVGIIILATDFFLLWLPLAHSLEYPTKVAALFMAVTALVTLLLALVTVKATEQSNSREYERLRIEQQTRDEERHRLALERIRDWAEGVIELVTRPTRHKLLGPRKIELQGLLHLGGTKSIGILKDAELVGHNLGSSVKRVHLTLFKFDAMLRAEEDIAAFKAEYGITDTINPIRDATELEEIKRELLTALMEVINRVTEQLVPLK